MTKTKETKTGRYYGVDRGNPGLDVVGDEVDRDIFPPQLISEFVHNKDAIKARAIDRRRAPARRSSELRNKLLAAGAVTTAIGALAAGAMTNRNSGESHSQSSGNQVMTVTNTLPNGQVVTEEIRTSEATPAQQLEEQVIRDHGKLPGTR